jgi:hypothetical protein
MLAFSGPIIAAVVAFAETAGSPAGQDCAERIFTSGFDPARSVTAFAATYDNFYRFEVSDPASFELVSSSHFAAMKLDYAGNDFTRAYGIDALGATFNTFAMVDTITGDVTRVGPSVPAADDDDDLGHGRWEGFRYDNTTGTAYASATNCGAGLSHLYAIDMATGAATVVGALTGMACAGAIAISPAGDMYGIDYSQNNLVTIDKLTGATTPIGFIGFDAAYDHDIEFDDATGTLYYLGYNNSDHEEQLRVFDVTTGRSTLIGPIEGPTYFMGLAIEASACW